MSKIDTENTKIMRQGLDVFCGLSYRDATAPITEINVTDTNEGLFDTNVTAALTNTSWKMLTLADLTGEGFELNPNNVPQMVSRYGHTASAANGKIGYRSSVGVGYKNMLSIVSTGQIMMLTIHIPKGQGYLIVSDGTQTTYTIQEYMYIKINRVQNVIISIHSTSDERIEIESIVSGVDMNFNNDTLISCVLDLRADLSMNNPTWQVSGIEINAYHPDDISEIVAGIGDDAPIYYYAGYADANDFCETRNFYVSDKITWKDNCITIKGEDISSKMVDFAINPIVETNGDGEAQKQLYDRLSNYITNCGITLRHKETAPTSSTSAEYAATITKNCSVREYVADVMNLARVDDGVGNNYYPRFIDAGIPTLKWRKPTSTWTIYEENVKDLKIEVERIIAKIKTEDDRGLSTHVLRESSWAELQSQNVSAGKEYDFSDSEYYWDYTVTNGTISNKKTKTNASKVTYTASANGTSVLKGKRAVVDASISVVTPEVPRAGITITMNPLTYGGYLIPDGQGAMQPIYPNYITLFWRSNITGSFTFRGDVRMQPRDVFTFRRMDGTEEICTIENIKITHQNGGTESEITYRKGIV